MKNKKITTIVIIAIVALCGFLGYTFYATSTEQKEVAKKEAEQPKTQQNIITEDGKLADRNGKKVDPTEQDKKNMEQIEDVEKAQAVFMELFTASTNINYNNAEQVKEYEKIVKETVHSSTLDDFLDSSKKNTDNAKLEKINMKEINQKNYIISEQTVKGYEFRYDFVVSINDEKQEITDVCAVVVLENGEYKVMGINFPIEK